MRAAQLLSLALVAVVAFLAGSAWVEVPLTERANTSRTNQSDAGAANASVAAPIEVMPVPETQAEMPIQAKAPGSAGTQRQPITRASLPGSASSLIAALGKLNARVGIDRQARSALLELLIEGLLDLDDPFAARSVLERFDMDLVRDRVLFQRVAKAFLKVNDSQAALDLYVKLMHRNPLVDDYFMASMRIDAAVTLLAVRSIGERNGGQNRHQLRPFEIQALIELGFESEARQLIETYMEKNPARALDLLAWIDPLAAHKQLQAKFDADPSTWAAELAMKFEEAGNLAAATQTLLEGLAAAPKNQDLLDGIIATAPLAAFTYYNANQRSEPVDHDTVLQWVWLGDELEDIGALPEAIQAWTVAFDSSEDGKRYGRDKLAEYAPTVLLSSQ